MPFDTSHSDQLADQVGRPVTLGLRPEHIEGGEQGNAIIRFAPQAIESLDPHTLLICSLNDAPFTAQVDVQFPAEPDQLSAISCDMTKAHVFDRETGQAIGR